jgi:hypothetical protein
MQRKIRIIIALVITSSILSGCKPESNNTEESPGLSSENTIQIITDIATVSESETSSETSPEETIIETTTVEQSTEGRIFPDSDTELIRWIDLYPLSLTELAFARNDFFAKEGYLFEKAEYLEHYQALPWYVPDTEFSYDKFNEVQLANILLIQIAEARAGNGLFYLPSGSSLDYDQDGTLEELTYLAPDPFTMQITIHDSEGDRNWVINCEATYGKVYIGDISYEDGILDFFADEIGASDDYKTYVSGITNQGFLMRGEVPESCSNVTVCGESVVTTLGRKDMLMTWFTKVRYGLNDAGELIYEKEPQYSFEDFPCTAIVDIPLRSSPDLSLGIDFTILAGTPVFLVTTDDVEWVKVRTADMAGWIHVTDETTITDLNLHSDKVFDGLVIAD